MIQNMVYGSGSKWPSKIVISPFARITKTYSSGSWTDDYATLYTNAKYEIVGKYFYHQTVKADTQSISYYKFYVEFEDGSKKELWDFVNAGKEVTINVTGAADYNNANYDSWNTCFCSSLTTEDPDGTYHVVYSSPTRVVNATKSITLNKEHFPYSQTGVNNISLTGINFYVSTYNSGNSDSYKSGAKITINSITIDEVSLPIEIQQWDDADLYFDLYIDHGTIQKPYGTTLTTDLSTIKETYLNIKIENQNTLKVVRKNTISDSTYVTWLYFNSSRLVYKNGTVVNASSITESDNIWLNMYCSDMTTTTGDLYCVMLGQPGGSNNDVQTSNTGSTPYRLQFKGGFSSSNVWFRSGSGGSADSVSYTYRLIITINGIEYPVKIRLAG